MTAFQIVTMVAKLLEAGQTPEQIAGTLEAMDAFGHEPPMTGENIADENTDEASDDPNADRRAALMAELQALDGGAVPAAVRGGNGRANNQPPQFRGGATPTVKYQMNGTFTPASLAKRLTGRKLQVASVVLAHNKTGITKRDILNELKAVEPTITPGAVMSALAPLGSVMGIIKSVPIAAASAAPKRATTPVAIRKPLGKR
jgi:hypothetical protein